MSKRAQVVLPDPVAHIVFEIAAQSGEPFSTVAARLIANEAARASKDGQVRSPRSVALPASTAAAHRPAWLAPYGDDTDWRAETWGSIVALAARYPDQDGLGLLQEGWWDNDQITEQLCALAAWRAQIDEASPDPREELVFHQHLREFAGILRQHGGGVAKAWTPGAPPSTWL